MIKVIMHGCNGRMGQMITGLLKNDKDACIAAGVDTYLGIENDYPTFASIEECDVEADVLIDFSNASSVEGLLSYCADKQIPVVLCTTGLSDEQMKLVRETSAKVAILKSANMSIGINLLCKLLGAAAPVLSAEGFDIEVLEKHHNQKLDAPSGTALALADAINESVDNKYTYVYDRSGRREKRPADEIGISAIRGGNIVGEHDVFFAGTDELITISHSATSRAVFGKGAIAAAKFLAGKTPGMYDMSDVIG